MQVAAYDKTQNKMAFFDPSRKQDFLFISGTKVYFSLGHKNADLFLFFFSFISSIIPVVSEHGWYILQMRNLAQNKETPPNGFMCPGGWQVLVEYYDTFAHSNNGKIPQTVPA